MAGTTIVETLQLLNDKVAPQRRVVHAGDSVYQAGERFANLCILNSGFGKIVNMAADGREQVVGLKFRGDWLGFDGIANGEYSCDAIAMGSPPRSWARAATLRGDVLTTAAASRPSGRS